MLDPTFDYTPPPGSIRTSPAHLAPETHRRREAPDRNDCPAVSDLLAAEAIIEGTTGALRQAGTAHGDITRETAANFPEA